MVLATDSTDNLKDDSLPSTPPSMDANSDPEGQGTLRPRLAINRPVWTVSDCYMTGSQEFPHINGLYNDLNGGDEPEDSSRGRGFSQASEAAKMRIKKQIMKTRQNLCTGDKILRAIISLFPCIGWLRTYKFKEYIVCDIISGITSAIFHVPQGMANALANAVAPVYGLYGSFFPSAVYSVMGTSMQCSVGTFTVVSLLAANAVNRLATVTTDELMKMAEHPHGNSSFGGNTNGTVPGPEKIVTPIQVTVAVVFVAGIIQVILGTLRLGRLGVLISPCLASGFMTGCAVQIIASQLKGCFNLSFKDFTGMFNVPLTFYTVAKNLPNANLITSIMSLCVCIVLIIGKDLANPKFQKLFRIPLPVDLLMVILCSIISYYMDLADTYKVPIVKTIPRGLPSPVVPDMKLVAEVIGDGFSVGLVGFAATFSMGTTFARRYNHKVDANQEFLALGCANIFSSFFLCLPACGSLARSSVLESVGCKTQLTGMLSCVVLALVLYFIAPLLEPLPKCVLATILATALKGYLTKVVEVKKLWAISRADAIVWVVTCLSVIILDVTYGLIIGVVITLLSVTWRMQGYRGNLLSEVETSGIYLPNSKKKKVDLCPDYGRLIILRFGNPICFATAANFEADCKRIIKQIKSVKPSDLSLSGTSYLVVDLSSSCFVDNTGVEAIAEGLQKCREAKIKLCLAAMPANVVKTLSKSGTLKLVGHENVFPTIADAVLACTNYMQEEDQGSSNFNSVPGSQVSLDISTLMEKAEELAKSEPDGGVFYPEDSHFYRQTNFSFRQNGRVTRASIISNENGQVVRTSYL